MTIAKDNTEKNMAKITDDNDTLIDLGEDGPDKMWTDDKYTETVELPATKEEWTETPGGFCKIDIDLDSEVREDLIDLWARANLNEASLETYEDLRKSDTQPEALYAAVLNDIIIESLTAQIARMEAAEEDVEADSNDAA